MIDITFTQITKSNVKQYKNLHKIFAKYKRQTLRNHGELPGNKKMFYNLFDRIIENATHDENKYFIVMQAENEFIGFACVEINCSDVVEIPYSYGAVSDFFITPKRRRKGFGRILNDYIENIFINNGMYTVLLFPDPVSGIDFWKAMGYKDTGIHQAWGRFLVYRKHLVENENTSDFDAAVSSLVTPTDCIAINPYNKPQLKEVYKVWKEYCKESNRTPHSFDVRKMAFQARKNRNVRFNAFYYKGNVIGFQYKAETEIRFVSSAYRNEVFFNE